MSFIIGLLTVVLVLNCLLLILLILIQLPKKDAGAGLAFGGGATDALFGAGSGNALTKITKWSAGIFFGLSLILSLMSVSVNKRENSLVLPKDLSSLIKPQPAAAPAPVAPATPASAPATPVTIAAPSNGLLNIPMPAPASTDAPAAK
jgi:preprotein translocase subunit SecG